MLSTEGVATIHIDGAARGNPGPAAYGLLIAIDGKPCYEESARLGDTTNNIAEYTALVVALTRALSMGASRLLVHSDSELMVKQMSGEYRVKNANLKVLYDQAVALRKSFENVEIRHVRRESNRNADRLCNEALDGRPVNPPQRAD